MPEWLSFGARTEHAGSLRADLRPVGDVIADIRQLPPEWSGFKGVECFHVLEHLLPFEAKAAVAELYRVLVPGGELCVAVPDLEACARRILAGDTDVLANIYSPDAEPSQWHRYGYTHKTLLALLVDAGFIYVREDPPHPSDPNEMRLVMLRPA